MSYNKEEIDPLEDNKIKLKGPKVQLTPSKYVEKQSSKSSFVETQTKLISIGQQESLRLEVEGAPSHKASKLEKPVVSSNQGDSLDKDDGYLSSSRQTSTRYSSSCTDDNKPTSDSFATYEKIQGRIEVINS